MSILRKILNRQNLLLVLGLAIVLVSQIPFLKTYFSLDFDTPSLISTINNCLGENARFAVDRSPGSPVYVLIFAALMFWVRQFFGLVNTEKVILGVSIAMSWLILLSSYQRSKKIVSDHWIQAFLLLALALHPVFIWHSFSAVEDMFALFCFAVSLIMVVKPPLKRLACIVFAMGVGSKISLLGAMPLFFAYYIDQDKGADALSIIKQLIEPFIIIVLVSVLLMLPAAVQFGMDPSVMFKSDYYNTCFHQRLDIGWFYIRTTILWWIPFGLYVIAQYVVRLVKYRKFSLIELADVPVLLIFLACFMPKRIFTPVILFASLIVVVLYFLKARGHADREFQFSRVLLIVLSVPCSVIFVMGYPFSRSLVLFTLIPILYSMSLRCRSVIVWFFIAAFSYLSMFHYVQVTAKRIVIHDFGYYEAFLKQMNNYYNDYGFLSDTKRQTVIYLLPGKKD